MTKQLEIGSVLKTETAYAKDMNITFDGQEVRVILNWDDHDGFDVQWLDLDGRWINAPAWADAIDEAGEMSVGYFLDSLTPHSRKEAA
jgi:hypothetical protein